MAQGSLAILLLVLQIRGILSDDGSVCYKYHYTYGAAEFVGYCKDGCCGDRSSTYCCYNYVGLIIGCVIAGLIVLSIIVSFIVCCVCTKIHRTGQKGRVIAPAPQPSTNVAVSFNANTGSTHQYNPGGYIGGFVQPPPYQQHAPQYTPNCPPPASLYDQPPQRGNAIQQLSPRNLQQGDNLSQNPPQGVN